jgi:hypothetical protein
MGYAIPSHPRYNGIYEPFSKSATKELFDIENVIYYYIIEQGEKYKVTIRKEKKNCTYDTIEVVADDKLKKRLKKSYIPVADLYGQLELNEPNLYIHIVKDYIKNIRRINIKYILIDIVDDINIIHEDVLINNLDNSFYTEINKMESTI